MKFKNSDLLFFTSDTHFYHSNIIKFCNRPYNSVEEMNKSLIENWNNKVPKDGIVFHLGDFVFGKFDKWKEIIDQLNGTIFLIEGNHDRRQCGNKKNVLFKDVFQQLNLQIDNNHLLLNHYPLLCYPKPESNIQLFGHVHTNPYTIGSDNSRLKYLYPTQYDVGVDNNNFTPITYSEVLDIINKQKSKQL